MKYCISRGSWRRGLLLWRRRSEGLSRLDYSVFRDLLWGWLLGWVNNLLDKWIPINILMPQAFNTNKISNQPCFET